MTESSPLTDQALFRTRRLPLNGTGEKQQYCGRNTAALWSRQEKWGSWRHVAIWPILILLRKFLHTSLFYFDADLCENYISLYIYHHMHNVFINLRLKFHRAKNQVTSLIYSSKWRDKTQKLRGFYPSLFKMSLNELQHLRHQKSQISLHTSSVIHLVEKPSTGKNLAR